MSVATFSQDLKVFTAEDNYSSPVTVTPSSSSNQNHGRITWSGDGKWLTVAPLDKGTSPLPIFKYANKQLQPLKYITLSNICSAAFFNWTNRNITVGNTKGEVFVWDIKEKKIATKIEYVEAQPIDYIDVNSDDCYIATGSLSSNKICLHGLKTNVVVNTITIPNSSHTSSLKFCLSKKNYLGVSSLESTVCVWDILRSEFIFKKLNSHMGACTDISFSPVNSQVLASVSLTKTLKIYDLRVGKMLLDTNFDEPLTCVDIIFNGDTVAMGTTGGSVIIYDLRAGGIFTTFKAHKGSILSVKTQNLKIPKTYQEVEMNTPDQCENPSKTLDISVMDIFSPISTNSVKDLTNGLTNQSKSLSIHSTPKLIITKADTPVTQEDSFLKKFLSPLPTTLKPKSHSSPLFPISETPDPVDEKIEINSQIVIKEEMKSELSESGGCGGGGDGFQVDNVSQRNFYYSDIMSEIRNSQKEVLNEINSIKKEVSDMKSEFDTKFKILQENFEGLSRLLSEGIKQEIYAGNCDSKIEHISQRILINELNDLMLSQGDQIQEQIRLNTLRLKHIYEVLGGVK